LRQFDEEIRQFNERQQQLTEFLEQTSVDLQKLTGQKETVAESIQKYSRQMQSLLQQNPWIKDHEGSFGQSEGAFNFSNSDLAESRRKLGLLQEHHSRLRKNINFNVMDMIDRYTSQLSYHMIVI